ncbi:MAG: DUF1080 domain-containing protein [Planctomycetota bacterium]|nr:MAG: DUF1080 domain-containing protein [Planctomycetota bacterium]
MTRAFVLALFTVITTVAFAASTPLGTGQDKPKVELPAPDADGWISLFNGKDLTGWEGNMDIWRVVDGYIQGKIDKIGYNTFLVYGVPFSDFVLEAKFILPKGGNSGIQYRSKVKDQAKFIVGGYQADIGGGYWGILYEEQGRGILVKPVKDVEKTIKFDDWNTFVVTANGSKVKHEVNGVVSVDFDDTDEKKRAAEGVIALQYHAPGNFEIRFKDIRIKPIKK